MVLFLSPSQNQYLFDRDNSEYHRTVVEFKSFLFFLERSLAKMEAKEKKSNEKKSPRRSPRRALERYKANDTTRQDAPGCHTGPREDRWPLGWPDRRRSSSSSLSLSFESPSLWCSTIRNAIVVAVVDTSGSDVKRQRTR